VYSVNRCRSTGIADRDHVHGDDLFLRLATIGVVASILGKRGDHRPTENPNGALGISYAIH